MGVTRIRDQQPGSNPGELCVKGDVMRRGEALSSMSWIGRYQRRHEALDVSHIPIS